MAANEESDPSAILNGFWVTLFGVQGFYSSGWRETISTTSSALS